MREKGSVIMSLPLFILSLIILAWGYVDLQVIRITKSDAKVLDCKTLIENGAGDNKYISLSGFTFSEGSYVYRTVTPEKGEPYWDSVWIPLFPAGVEQKSSNIRLLLCSEKTRNKADLDTLLNSSTLQGIVLDGQNNEEELPGKATKFLQQGYKGLDIKHTIIFEAGKKPPKILILCLKVVGAVLIALGAVQTAKQK